MQNLCSQFAIFSFLHVFYIMVVDPEILPAVQFYLGLYNISSNYPWFYKGIIQGLAAWFYSGISLLRGVPRQKEFYYCVEHIFLDI